MTYYIANNFSAVAFKSKEDLEAYQTKRLKYFLGSEVSMIVKYDYLPNGVKLIEKDQI